MNKKEQTPLAVHKAIEPFLVKKDELFIRIDSDKDLVRFRGKSIDSNFYFYIKSHRFINGKNQINIEFQPYTPESVMHKSMWIDCKAQNIEGQFQIWFHLLNEYNETKTAFDDPIIDGFAQDYFSDFEIIDDEKDSPLDTHMILPIYYQFEQMSIKLNECKDQTNLYEIENIRSDINDLNNSLTNTGRQEILKKVTKIWAKMTKLGVKYKIEFVDVSRKLFMQETAWSIFRLAERGTRYLQQFDAI